MKTFTAFLFIVSLVVPVAHGQGPDRVGYANVEYILSQMPDLKAVEADLKAVEDQLAKTINSKTADLQQKYADYVSREKDMLLAVRQSTQRELQILGESLEKLKVDGQATYEKKYLELMQPLYRKVGDAIASVAKERGYALILNAGLAGQDIVLYGDTKDDVSDLVLQKLGITSTASTAAGN